LVTALVTANLITALVTGALVTANRVTGALIAAALIPALVTTCLVTARRLPATGGLLVATAGAAPTVAPRRFGGGVACRAVILCRPGRLRASLGVGMRSVALLDVSVRRVGLPDVGVRRVGLLGIGRLGFRAAVRRALGLAIAARPVARGLVEGELLLSGPIRANTAASAVADAGPGGRPDTGLRVSVWFHGVLLPQASRVSSRGRGTLV
jgi:hypothetical protein